MVIAMWIAGITALALLLTLLSYRDWMRHWGSTTDEATGVQPGDGSVHHATAQTTRAITINARPEHIFPWLVQMGNRRGGLYSYDWLDRVFGFLDMGSVKQILPEYQDLKVGDVIPVGRGGDFPVTGLERNKYLILSGKEKEAAWSWQMVLVPVNEHSTRFISRNRMRIRQTLLSGLFMLALEVAAFIMTRKWMLNVKRLAEYLAHESGVTVPQPSAPIEMLAGKQKS